MPLINCPECETRVSNSALACPKCGFPCGAASQTDKQSANNLTYAGFWKRFAAHFIDCVILWVALYPINSLITEPLVVKVVKMVMLESGVTDKNIAMLIGALIGLAIGGTIDLIPTWLYHSVMTSSSTQATLGKMILGIKVTDLTGNRVSFGRATGRHFGAFISGFIFGIGYIMVAFTKKKQGLHDMMSGCLVVNK